MIAYAAERLIEKGVHARLRDCDVKQRYRIEEATVP
jgi:tRNA A37 threonylcarbamoyltransferase TsaD